MDKEPEGLTYKSCICWILLVCSAAALGAANQKWNIILYICMILYVYTVSTRHTHHFKVVNSALWTWASSVPAASGLEWRTSGTEPRPSLLRLAVSMSSKKGEGFCWIGEGDVVEQNGFMMFMLLRGVGIANVDWHWDFLIGLICRFLVDIQAH